jgi:hypothetical protein
MNLLFCQSDFFHINISKTKGLAYLQDEVKQSNLNRRAKIIILKVVADRSTAVDGHWPPCAAAACRRPAVLVPPNACTERAISVDAAIGWTVLEDLMFAARRGQPKDEGNYKPMPQTDSRRD